ncbi:SNF1-interacting protein, partial [Rhizophlyctis rosea]
MSAPPPPPLRPYTPPTSTTTAPATQQTPPAPLSALPSQISQYQILPTSQQSTSTSIDPPPEKFENHPLSLQLAATDSPYFRATIDRFEDDLDELSKWLEGLCKVLRQYAEELIKTNEVTTLLVSKLSPQPEIKLFDNSVNQIFSEAIQTVYSFRAKLVDDMIEHLIGQLQQFLRNDVRELKEARKNFDKLQERYDAAVLRYAALSKSKETSALREDAFILYDTRKLYIKQCLDYTLRILLFRNAAEALILEQFMSTTLSHMDFNDAAAQVFKGLKPALDAVRGRVDAEREDNETLENSL